MTEPADAPKFTKARRNRTFALGVAAGAVLMLGANLAIGATGNPARSAAGIQCSGRSASSPSAPSPTVFTTFACEVPST